MLSKPKIIFNQELQQAPIMSNTTDINSITDDSSFTDVPTAADVAPSKRSQVLLVTSLVICAIGVIGNALAIFVFFSGRQLTQKPINLFFMHQAFIDMMACVFTILNDVLFMFNIVGPGICHLLTSDVLATIPLYTSSYNFVILTIERHFAVVNPLHYNSEKLKKRLPLIFIAEWAVVSILLSIFSATTVYENGTCILIKRMHGTIFMDIIPPYLVIFSIGIPVPTMIICYARMLNVLRNATRPTGTTSVTTNSKAIRAAQINLFQTCIIMLIFFLAAWITDQSAVLLLHFGTYNTLKTTHFTISRLMMFIASTSNPYIWAIRYDDFQKQMLYILGCKQNSSIDKSTATAVSVISEYK